MTMTNPLRGPVPQEIPLKNAPLVKVVAQLKFPVRASIEKQSFIAEFQEAIRKYFPILRSEQINIVRSSGLAANVASQIWRFFNAQETWIVSLATDFIAIQTSHYTSRRDFLEKWEKVLLAANKYLGLEQYDRLGVRYIDRIEEGAIANIKKLVRKEALGIINHFAEQEILHTFSETLFKIEDSQLKARWGKLNANTTFDPGAIEPKARDSWVLDLDMFRIKTESLELEKLMEMSNFYAERIYAFFRWVVTDEFLKYYGGDV